MNSGLQGTRKCFLVLISLVVINVLLVVIYKFNPDFFPKRFQLQTFILAIGLHGNSSNNNNIAMIEDGVLVANGTEADRKYIEMINDYGDRISRILRHKYNPAKTNIDIGSPISSMLNTSRELSSQTKLILVWSALLGKIDWVHDGLFENCYSNIINRCHITADRSKLSKSHAVLMHDISKGLPPSRQSWQRWIYFTMESPVNMNIKLSDFDGVFNWTSSYRRDTDQRVGYGGFYKMDEPLKPSDVDVRMSAILKSKRKLISAAISNCDSSSSSRLKYIAELKKYIPVDFYGKCGTMNLPRDKKQEEFFKQYKFHLAFENSHCRDYITEKFWRPLMEWSSVPVVIGAAPEDYLAVASNQSFIDTVGFESPKKLAEYLHLLDKNDHLYRRYFTWHADQAVDMGYLSYVKSRHKPWCKICSDLNNMSLPIKSYRDFANWYREDYCKK